MWPVPDTYADLVTSSHGLQVTVDVWKAGVKTFPGLPIVTGSIPVSSTSVTRRTISITVPPFLRTGTYGRVPALPANPADVLGHYGQELHVTHSLVAPDGSILPIPVGVFRIDSASGSDLGLTEITVTGVSREAYVSEDTFTSPRTVSGPSAIAIIRTLILESLPSVEVAVLTRRDRRVTPTTYETDRWGAILELATSLSVQVYSDPMGRFVITDLPTLASPAVWRFAPKSVGTLLDSQRASSRQGVNNLVAVQGATPAGGTVPITGVARDDNPTSPTRYGDPLTGAFGMVPTVISMPSLADLASCQAAAAAQLALSTGAAEGLDLTAVPVAALEALDVVEIVTDPDRTYATTRRHMLDSFTLPLTAGGQFPASTRDIGAPA